MPAIGYHRQTRAANLVRNLARKLGRRRLIAVADKDQRRTFDRAKPRPRIRPGHDRLLLTQEGFDAGFRGHRAYRLLQAGIVVAIAVNVNRKSDIRHLGITAALGEGDHDLAPLRLLRGLGACAGIEERKLGHPWRRLANDFERDVAAHR